MVIESPANPAVKALRSLELPKNVRARGEFLVEGVRAVEDGLRAGLWPATCLFNPELLERTERGASLLRQLNRPAGKSLTGAGPLEATQRALEAASATQHPQGVVAAFPLVAWPEPAPRPGSRP